MESQEVVLVLREFGDRGFEVESGVRAVPVVEMKPRLKMGGADGGVGISASVGPFAQRGLDEAFGFAICARSVWTSEEMTQGVCAAGRGKRAGAVTTAVVAHESLRLDAQRAEIGQGRFQEGQGALG